MPRTYYPAVIVPDERFTADTFDVASSTLTQAGPLPGIPEAPDGAALLLEAGGVQAAGETRYVRVSRAGMPGVDSLGVLTRLSTDAADEWLGWEMPTSITAWLSLDYTTTAQVLETFDFSACVRTALREFNPDLVLCAGPGTSLRAPVGHVVLREGWRGLRTREQLFAADLIVAG